LLSSNQPWHAAVAGGHRNEFGSSIGVEKSYPASLGVAKLH